MAPALRVPGPPGVYATCRFKVPEAYSLMLCSMCTEALILLRLSPHVKVLWACGNFVSL